MTVHNAEFVWGVDWNQTPKRGDKVWIPKGAWITGTHPKGAHNAGRTYQVSVHDYDHYNGVVCWVGAGGYWHYTVEWGFRVTHNDGKVSSS